MSFTFRKTKIELPFYGLTTEEKNGKQLLTYHGERYSFYTPPYLPKDMDYCHCYSYYSICKYLCWCYNNGNIDLLAALLMVFYPKYNNYLKLIAAAPDLGIDTAKLNDILNTKEYFNIDISTTNPYEASRVRREFDDIFHSGNALLFEDFDDALEVLKNLCSSTNNLKTLYLFNALLYILNNAQSNLRPGNAKWNNSIGSAYDPIEWYYDFFNDIFILPNNEDRYRLSILTRIKMKPTFWFYTAKYASDFVCSSNNSIPFLKVEQCDSSNKKIAIKKYNGTLMYLT